jgi:hypothetical protein
LDVAGIWSRGGRGPNSGEGSSLEGGSSTGQGSGGNSGKSSGLSQNKTEFTQAGASGKKPGAGKSNTSMGQGEISGTTSTPGGRFSTPNKKWWPICAFLDESISESEGSASLKGVADAANACGVTIVFWTRTVKTSSWGGSNPDAINKNQVDKCNIPSELAAAASTTALVPYNDTAAKMCDAKRENGDWNTDVAGCAQLRSGSSISKKAEDAMKSNAGGEHLSAASGNVAPSIEVPSGWGAGVVGHESIGHSEMGKMNGTKYGRGIGDDPSEGEGSAETDWTPAGCAVMYAMALDNTQNFIHDPTRQNYYYKPKDPSFYYDIANGPKIFSSDQNIRMNGPRLPIVSQPGQVTVVQDGAPKAQNTPQQPPATEPPEVDGSRHRKRRLPTKNLSLSEKAAREVEEVPGAVRKPKAPPAAEPVKAGGRLAFDDSAPKRTSGSSDSFDGQSPSNGGSVLAQSPPAMDESGDVPESVGKPEGPPAVDPVNAGGRVAFDDNAPKRTLGSGDALDRQPASGGGALAQSPPATDESGAGASIAYDENNPRGGKFSSGGTSNAFPAKTRAAGSPRGGAPSALSAYNSTSSSLSGDGFFEEIGEGSGSSEKKTREPLRGQSLRSQRGLDAASGADPERRSPREPASSRRH